MAGLWGSTPSFLGGIYENAARSPLGVADAQSTFDFSHKVWYNLPVSTSGQIRLRLARDQKAGGVVPTGTDAFFPAEVPSAPVHPDTVTHGHGDTVAGHVVSVYACLVVAVYGDWVLS